MLRRLSVLALAAIPVLFQGCVFSQHKAVGSRQQAVDHVANSQITVDTKNGSVQISRDASAARVSIDATITCTGDTDEHARERLEKTTLSIVRDADDALTVSPRFPDKRRGDGASFVITLPDAHGINIDTSNGSVTVSDLAGKLVVDTSNARITVEDHDGPATLETSNGSIVATRITGSLFADTSNGSITAKDVAGPVTVDTSNGSITLALADGETGPIRADTSNASITISVGDGFQGRVRFDTSNGRLTVNDPDGRITSRSVGRNDGTIEVGTSGGEASIVDTSNGNITFSVGG